MHTVILRRVRPNGETTDTIANDDMRLTPGERRQWCEAMNRYLVSQGSQLRAIYLLKG